MHETSVDAQQEVEIANIERVPIYVLISEDGRPVMGVSIPPLTTYIHRNESGAVITYVSTNAPETIVGRPWTVTGPFLGDTYKLCSPLRWGDDKIPPIRKGCKVTFTVILPGPPPITVYFYATVLAASLWRGGPARGDDKICMGVIFQPSPPILDTLPPGTVISAVVHSCPPL